MKLDAVLASPKGDTNHQQKNTVYQEHPLEDAWYYSKAGKKEGQIVEKLGLKETVNTRLVRCSVINRVGGITPVRLIHEETSILVPTTPE